MRLLTLAQFMMCVSAGLTSVPLHKNMFVLFRLGNNSLKACSDQESCFSMIMYIVLYCVQVFI